MSRLDELMQQQQRELSPSRELWTGIEHALVQRQLKARSQRNLTGWYYGLAAALVMTISGLVWWQMPTATTAAPASLVEVLNQHQQQQRQLMLASFKQLERTPSIATEKELAQLREAASAISEALQREPDNKALLDMLRYVHQQELELLRLDLQNTARWRQI